MNTKYQLQDVALDYSFDLISASDLSERFSELLRIPARETAEFRAYMDTLHRMDASMWLRCVLAFINEAEGSRVLGVTHAN